MAQWGSEVCPLDIEKYFLNFFYGEKNWECAFEIKKNPKFRLPPFQKTKTIKHCLDNSQWVLLGHDDAEIRPEKRENCRCTQNTDDFAQQIIINTDVAVVVLTFFGFFFFFFKSTFFNLVRKWARYFCLYMQDYETQKKFSTGIAFFLTCQSPNEKYHEKCNH